MALIVIVSYIALTIGVLQALIIIIDVIKYPQKMMPIMNIVWPLTGLYFPVFGIWAYYGLGRSKVEMEMIHMDMESGMEMHIDMSEGNHSFHETHNDMAQKHHHHSSTKKPFWQSVFLSTTHCSSGCSLGDLIGAPIVFWFGLTIAGSMLFADYVVEFILAYLLGLGFQYYGMGFKKHEKPGQVLKDAIKADTWSLVTFEIGMFGWMTLVHFNLFTNVPEPNSPVFWFMMQVAMMIGFLTSYPANWYLVKKGVKHAM